uniref:Uncharacterized protein n=1 Tax=Arundo donax TaxID=35708 RepID=A0A0A8Y404_ARUDO
MHKKDHIEHLPKQDNGEPRWTWLARKFKTNASLCTAKYCLTLANYTKAPQIV